MSGERPWGIIGGTGLDRLRNRTAELKNVEGVIGVLSLAEIKKRMGSSKRK